MMTVPFVVTVVFRAGLLSARAFFAGGGLFNDQLTTDNGGAEARAASTARDGADVPLIRSGLLLLLLCPLRIRRIWLHGGNLAVADSKFGH